MPRCGVRSRVTFSNTWGTTVFLVLHLFALALCFSMSRGRPFHVFKLYFSVLAKKRPKPFKYMVWAIFGGPDWGPQLDHKKTKSVPMQRGVRSVLRRSVLMQRGARFWIFDVPLGGPTWPQ